MLGSSAIHTQHIIGAGFPRDSPELAKGWSSVVHECDLFSQKKAMNENVQDEDKEKVHNSGEDLRSCCPNHAPRTCPCHLHAPQKVITETSKNRVAAISSFTHPSNLVVLVDRITPMTTTDSSKHFRQPRRT